MPPKVRFETVLEPEKNEPSAPRNDENSSQLAGQRRQRFTDQDHRRVVAALHHQVDHHQRAEQRDKGPRDAPAGFAEHLPHLAAIQTEQRNTQQHHQQERISAGTYSVL